MIAEFKRTPSLATGACHPGEGVFDAALALKGQQYCSPFAWRSPIVKLRFVPQTLPLAQAPRQCASMSVWRVSQRRFPATP